ncbi:helix-turn-helix domain-containing protein [Phytoactinopolyspora halotolerans]|uniref:Uncharacterized protein n=1 Tax=Phytoactinopolyspora halotolerans TaxID=1981512 RepID=A0A6L9S6S5_9ACTN|nr:helix-turn-helix domain-containing protein [Phytoactinopolyspora halotolerans]NEE01165.1 hypothetical protein [Phytoactinopolyspora halotolerans]
MAEVDRIKSIADPVQRALEVARMEDELAEVHAELRSVRRAAVLELRQAGWSHRQIGEALGIHPNRAQQIAEGRSR